MPIHIHYHNRKWNLHFLKTQQQLFCEYRTVAECEQKAVRLERMIKKYLGYNAYWDIYHALLSDDEEKGTAVFKSMQESRNIRDSRKIMDHLGNPDVAKVFALSRSVSNEAHMYEEFIRFRELDSGILFSEITPKAQILTCVADHFTDRFPLENWMIYDKTHQVFLVHREREQWGLVWGEALNREAADAVSEKEMEYKEFKYTPNLKRPISIIDPETTEEVKPVLYFDKDTNEVKGKCKLKPYKSYFAFEIRDKKDDI